MSATNLSRDLPTTDQLKAALLQAICDTAERHCMSVTVFCRRAVGDTRFPSTLRNPSRSITLRTYGMVVDFIRLLDEGPAARVEDAMADRSGSEAQPRSQVHCTCAFAKGSDANRPGEFASG